MIEHIAIGRLIACVSALCIAGYLAFNSKDGWGWFLFASVALGTFNVTVGNTKEQA